MKCFTVVSISDFEILQSGKKIYNESGQTSVRRDGKFINMELGDAWEIMATEEPPFKVYVQEEGGATVMEPYDTLKSLHHWVRWSCTRNPVLLELLVPDEFLKCCDTKYGYISHAFIEYVDMEMIEAAYTYRQSNTIDGICIHPIFLKENVGTLFTHQDVHEPRIGGMGTTEFYKVGGWTSCHEDLTVVQNFAYMNRKASETLVAKLGLDSLKDDVAEKVWSAVKDKRYGDLSL